MDGWVGFTDDDLKRLKSGQTKGNTASNARGPRTAPRGKPSQNRPQRRLNPSHETVSGVTPDQMLAPPKSKPLPARQDPGGKATAPSKVLHDSDSNNNPGYDTGPGATNQTAGKQGALDHGGDKATESKEEERLGDSQDTVAVQEKNLKELNETEGISRELCNMVNFQQQQKMMEELNKKKRDMLAMEIKQRQKATKAESRKLMNIQHELDKLDQMLNADVAIIRDRIEEASRDFLEAQRHYERVERQFIEAKMDLHKKEVNKEGLTEHLYTIIHQNEVRKARKLEDLMHKLELEAAGEESLPELGPLQLPQLAVINPIQLPRSPQSPGGTAAPTEVPPSEESGNVTAAVTTQPQLGNADVKKNNDIPGVKAAESSQSVQSDTSGTVAETVEVVTSQQTQNQPSEKPQEDQQPGNQAMEKPHKDLEPGNQSSEKPQEDVQPGNQSMEKPHEDQVQGREADVEATNSSGISQNS